MLLFPRIGSQVDLLKDSCRMRSAERQRACGGKPKKMRQSLVADDVFMAKHDKKIVFQDQAQIFLDFFFVCFSLFPYFLIYWFKFGECDHNS